MLLPKPAVASRLFLTGATLGPIIDGLHNQVLLRYKVAPVNIQWTDEWSLMTSWAVPPLLGIAYVVLGGVLPQVVQTGMENLALLGGQEGQDPKPEQSNLRLRAVAAVLSTALIIRCSEELISTSAAENGSTLLGGFFNTAFFETATLPEQHLVLLLTLAIVQWAWLDSTLVGLLVASVAAVGGPLSEIPFVAAGWWEYLAESGRNAGALYYPLSSYPDVSLHSLTGPCYFAVTMDAIALGRWFGTWDDEEEEEDKEVVNWESGTMNINNTPVNNAPSVLTAVASSTSSDDDTAPSHPSST